MKVIGRSGGNHYDDFLVQMSHREVETLTGKSAEKGQLSTGSTVDVAAIFNSTQAILNLGSSIAYHAKALIASGEHAQHVAEKISAAVVIPPPVVKFDRGDTDSGAM